MNKAKKTPEFKSEAEERAFWESHDSTEFRGLETGTARPIPKLEAVYQDYLLEAARVSSGPNQD